MVLRYKLHRLINISSTTLYMTQKFSSHFFELYAGQHISNVSGLCLAGCWFRSSIKQIFPMSPWKWWDKTFDVATYFSYPFLPLWLYIAPSSKTASLRRKQLLYFWPKSLPLWTTKAHFGVHKTLILFPILGRINLNQNLPHYFYFEILFCFNIHEVSNTSL